MGAKHTVGVMLAVAWAVSLMGETVNASARPSRADGDAWARTAIASVRAQLNASGMSLPQANRIATALVSHWAIETGWGGSQVYRDGRNPAGVRAGSGEGGAVVVGASGARYRSWPSLDAATRDVLALYQGGAYAPAWRELVADLESAGTVDALRAAGERWYRALVAAGWSGPGGIPDYPGVWSRVAELVTGA